jgi:bifunctional non-homologous end joining protein LigD
VSVRPAFVNPRLPVLSQHPPKGRDWVHQAKWDGYRCLIVKDGPRVRLFSKRGTEWTDRLRQHIGQPSREPN